MTLWPLAAGEIARLAGGELAGDPTAQAERVLIDSRAGIRGRDLFVGLVGPHFDGGRFARQALAEGASVALVSREHGATAPGVGQALITVEDPLAALQALAAEARRRFEGRVIAITGSHGKTTVKDMLAAILAGEHRVAASPMSYNSQVGVALALLQLDPGADLALVECGISLPGEMERLAAMVRPHCGILTAIGDAHLEGLGRREVTAREKARLFAHLGGGPEPEDGWVVTAAGDELARASLTAVGAKVITVGGPGADLVLDRERLPPRLRRQDTEALLDLAETAPHWLEDAALAAAAALLLGASPAAVEAGLAGWQPAPMRLEISTTPRGLLLINDAYTADPASMEAALLALARERSPGASVAVLGGMAQLGRARAAAHTRAGQRVAELGIGRLVGVGEGGAEIAAAAVAAGMPAARVHTVRDPSEAAMVLEERCRAGDRVLLKASRPARLERVAALLFDSVSPARLFIDLDALVGNFHRIRRAVGRNCAVMAVVKSFGYGLDAVRVAKALERAGIDYFAVAYPDEGVALRDHGITSPILVQNVLPQEVDKVARYALTAQVSSIEQASLVAAEAERQQRAVRVHLKVDTGMGRAGAAPARARELAMAIAASPWLALEGLMTHFASAEDPSADDFTREQIRQFDAVRATLAASRFFLPFRARRGERRRGPLPRGPLLAGALWPGALRLCERRRAGAARPAARAAPHYPGGLGQGAARRARGGLRPHLRHGPRAAHHRRRGPRLLGRLPVGALEPRLDAGGWPALPGGGKGVDGRDDARRDGTAGRRPAR